MLSKKEKQAAYRIRHSERIREYRKQWNMDNKEKKRAHGILWRAMNRGEIIRRDTCEKCGSKEYVDAHHHDYSKPIDVHWICRKCHTAEHGGVPKSPRTFHTGEKHHSAKLTSKQVTEIRRLLKTPGVIKRQLARDFKVDEALIRQIEKGQIWTRK